MKKVFFLLTAMIISNGMWAESVMFDTYRRTVETFEQWSDLKIAEENQRLLDDCAVQQNQYVKVAFVNPTKEHNTYVYSPAVVGAIPNIHYSYYLWITASQLEVSLLDNHATIESVVVKYAADVQVEGPFHHIAETNVSMKYTSGQTSQVLTFSESKQKVMSIIVNYSAPQKVAYVDADGTTKVANNVTEITNESDTLNAGWYVVDGTDVWTAGLVCNGDVHLILADGAKLTAVGDHGSEAGIRVSGEGNSLTIYGQSEQTGKLITRGEINCAGIGGAEDEDGSNITINGGDITATTSGKGYAAGMGGGKQGAGTNITINGGKVTASGGKNAAGIGGGFGGTASNIYVSASLLLKADENDPPTTVINHTSDQDVADALANKQYTTTVPIPLISTTYIDGNGALQTADACEITNTSTTLYTGWYVVLDADVQTAGLVCNGDVHLILADGAKLTAKGGSKEAGIRVSGEGNSLTIYGQQHLSGQLIAIGGGGAAGIGGGFDYAGSNITIHGGAVTAIGDTYASGIGSGNFGGTASNIFVNSLLLLKADGNNPPVSIIPHTSGQDVADSLSGKRYAVARLQIKDIPVTFDKQGGTGGVTRVTVDEGAMLPTISSLPVITDYAFQGYFSEPDGKGTKYYNADGTGAHTCDFLEEKTLYAYWLLARVPYIDADGKAQIAINVKEITNESATLTAGWYVVLGTEVQTGSLTCNGDVHLILADDATLATKAGNLRAGILVSGNSNSLTIYGQTAQSGQLTTYGTRYGAGIGGEYECNGSNITINGGIITATGGEFAAGIGGGGDMGQEGTHITINGGTVTATGGVCAAGIGGGRRGNGSYITINGGTITATGGDDGAGIGSGYKGYGHHITINGGTVMAVGGFLSSAIGAGDSGTSSDIFVSSSLLLKADENDPPTTIISHTSDEDLAQTLHNKDYVLIEPNHTPTELEAVQSAECKVQSAKVLRDGQLSIKRAGRVYNAQGALMY